MSRENQQALVFNPNRLPPASEQTTPRNETAQSQIPNPGNVLDY